MLMPHIKLTCGWFLCAAVLGTFASAAAQEGPPPAPLPDPLAERVADGLRQIERDWKAWDGNSDDVLSPDEFTRSGLTRSVAGLEETQPADWDRDGDGRITRNECRLVLEIAWGLRRPQGDRVRLTDGRCVGWMGYKLIDRDRDDALTLEECRQYGYDGERVDANFRESDTNGDGRVTYAEWAAMPMRSINPPAELRRMDADRDGGVSREELIAHAPDWQSRLAAYMLPAFDRDGDGRLTYDEYAACPLANLQQLWHDPRPDADQNGTLEFAEFRQAQGIDAAALEADIYLRLDLNGDGSLDANELFFESTAIPAEVRFPRWDDDGNGSLSELEFLALAGPSREIARRDFHLSDHDGDGALTVAEFATVITVFAGNSRGALLEHPILDRARRQIAEIDNKWRVFDANGDGQVSLAEFVVASQGLFTVQGGVVFTGAATDRDGNGAVSREEAKAFVEAIWGVRRRDGALLREPSGLVYNLMHFGHLDRARDDGLTLEELSAHPFPDGRVHEIFRDADTDESGQISFEEWKRVPHLGVADPIAEFRHLDADLNGLVDPAELKERVPDWKRQLAARIFPAFDIDRDGSLSLTEYRFCPIGNSIVKWHEPLTDQDHDGRLSFAEFAWQGTDDFPALRWEYFTTFDQNGDGLLERREFLFNTRIPDEFYILNADGTGWRKLFTLADHPQCGSPAISPDGKRLAFDACRINAQGRGSSYKVFVAGIDGSNPRELCVGNMPTWSPDGQTFVCSRSVQPHGVWLMTAEGQEHRHVSQAWGAQLSPDGSRLAYYDGTRLLVHDLRTDQVLEVMSADANPYSQIFWNMTWSPDSSRICFKGLRPDGVMEIAVVNASGAELGFKVHHRGGTINADFAWHPEGRRLVFSMLNTDLGRVQLYELDPDGDGPPVLMPGQDPDLNNTDACWTPDGTQLIVVSGDY
jgi:Ca2+-binding EF-hand superfamily protein